MTEGLSCGGMASGRRLHMRGSPEPPDDYKYFSGGLFVPFSTINVPMNVESRGQPRNAGENRPPESGSPR